jgi:hypothetical protein
LTIFSLVIEFSLAQLILVEISELKLRLITWQISSYTINGRSSSFPHLNHFFFRPTNIDSSLTIKAPLTIFSLVIEFSLGQLILVEIAELKLRLITWQISSYTIKGSLNSFYFARPHLIASITSGYNLGSQNALITYLISIRSAHITCTSTTFFSAQQTLTRP